MGNSQCNIKGDIKDIVGLKEEEKYKQSVYISSTKEKKVMKKYKLFIDVQEFDKKIIINECNEILKNNTIIKTIMMPYIERMCDFFEYDTNIHLAKVTDCMCSEQFKFCIRNTNADNLRKLHFKDDYMPGKYYLLEYNEYNEKN